MLCDGNLGGALYSSLVSYVFVVSSNTWSDLVNINTSDNRNICPLPLLFLDGYCLLQLSAQPSFQSELVSSVANAPDWWVIFFVVQLHRNLHTWLQFMLLMTMSWPPWLFGWYLIPPHCFSGFRQYPIRKMPSYPDYWLGFTEVLCINITCQYHVTCMVRDYHILVWSHTI